MLFRSILTTARRTAALPRHVPRRSWAQVGIAISTPPRNRVSYGEKLLHFAFMYFVWFAPVLYFLTQIKVWRREYVS